MKKMSISLFMCFIFLSPFFISPLGSLAQEMFLWTFIGADPGGKEMVGTHIGSSGNPNPPQNMILVPAGKVKIGLSLDDVMALSEGQVGLFNNLSRSLPKHQEKVDAFFCDIFEVTNLQWMTYLEQTGQKPSDDLKTYSWKGQDKYIEKETNFPIRNVSLNEARNSQGGAEKEFQQRLNGRGLLQEMTAGYMLGETIGIAANSAPTVATRLCR